LSDSRPSLIIGVWITEPVRWQISTRRCSTQPARGRLSGARAGALPPHCHLVTQHKPGTGGALVDGADEIAYQCSSGFRIA
jgi:hypothetical protein